MKVYRESAFLFGVRLTSWHWRWIGNECVLSRWIVFYVGPWSIETEFIRYMENDE